MVIIGDRNTVVVGDIADEIARMDGAGRTRQPHFLCLSKGSLLQIVER